MAVKNVLLYSSYKDGMETPQYQNNTQITEISLSVVEDFTLKRTKACDTIYNEIQSRGVEDIVLNALEESIGILNKNRCDHSGLIPTLSDRTCSICFEIIKFSSTPEGVAICDFLTK